jgi:hypothetical protein
MIDCDIQPPRESIQLLKNSISPEQAVRQKRPIYPTYTQWRSLVIQILDRDGGVIEDAIVVVDCPQDSGAVQNGMALTDDRGLTPADFPRGAVLIMERKLQATDDPESPREFTFTYRVAVHKPGYKTTRVLLTNNERIPRPLIVPIELLNE